MAKVNKIRTLRKAISRGAQYAAVAVAALSTVPVPDDVGTSEKAAIVFVIAAVGAVCKGIQNYRKISGRAPHLGSRSGYVLLLAAGAAVTGCVTTTAPDGTITQRVDADALETMWDRYERLQERRERLPAGLERAAVDREITALGYRLGVMTPG